MPSVARPALKVEIDFTSGALTETGITWVDVTQYVKGTIKYDWGREKAVGEFQPGRGSFTLDNRSGLFDPSNSSGTYYGQLKPRRKVRISAFGDGAAGHLPTGGFVIASGWIEGWPQRIIGRKLVEVDITFFDFLAVAARLPMPDSVYDWQIGQTAPFCWYKMTDPTYPAIDASGNGRHGNWQVYEGVQPPWMGLVMPGTTLKAGETDPVIVGADRPGRSWALMQAEVGQPLGGVPSGSAPRTPALVCHKDTAGLLADDFSVEIWVKPRQAFPLTITNSYTGTTPMFQPLVTWGNPGAGGAFGGVRYELALRDVSFAPSVFTFIASGSGSFIDWDAMTDGAVHQVVYVYDKVAAGPVPAMAVYVDGVLRHNYDITSLVGAGGFNASGRAQAVIGQATGFPEGLQSTLGDVVFWDRQLTAAEVLKNYRAGGFGNLEVSGTNPLTAPNAFTHAFEMAGASIQFQVFISADPVRLQPASLKGKSLADYLRQISSSEQGNLFWDPSGSTWGRVQFWDRNWPISDTVAGTSQATMSDASGATFGYAEVNYRDGSDLIANDVTVTYVGGEQRVKNATSIDEYGSVTGSVSTILVSQEQAFQVAAYRVWKYGQPPSTTIVPEHVQIEPDTLVEFNIAARARPNQRITLVRTRPDATTFTDDYWIDGVSQEIEAEGNGPWRTTLKVSSADDPGNAKPFVAGTSTAGGTDVAWL